ncbi:MAG: hypothetical protein WBA10_04340 [Elainellaceae cyanobacterium]
MKLSFRGVVYESPFLSTDVYSISDFPSQYGALSHQMSQIPGLDAPKQSNAPQYSYAENLYLESQTQTIAVPLLPSPIASILVAVWEPAPLDESRIRPFHFVAKYLLSSQQAVFGLLKHYHTVYLDTPENPAPHFFIGVRGSLIQMMASLPG